MMKRHSDWPEKLAEFIEARRKRAFSWGQQDCALFAADGILVMTGVDPAEGLRGYRSVSGAAKRIKQAGGMRELATSFPEKPVGLAQRGDLVLADVDGRESFGLVAGAGVWCGPGVDGLVFRPMSDVVAAFEV